jgi:hypothetical protein
MGAGIALVAARAGFTTVCFGASHGSSSSSTREMRTPGSFPDALASSIGRSTLDHTTDSISDREVH